MLFRSQQGAATQSIAHGVEAAAGGTLNVAENIEQGLSPSQRKDWQSGTPSRWANEAHAIAREHIYPPLGGARDLRLPRDYADREAPLARILLAKAGVRLAWLLNMTLK